ncbi:hypothetical protein BDQ12DRAFT_726060 [Crucibulum laeve]|uniref:Uncharacterized protein n=1 Tax=Crucibulum laeve TaxID=68775 RepID=A0A5C3LQ72_9AGAR|nr:hypothetical protein BDQ12DRAFT_726060 [Crucibulum laeve]
MPALWHIEHQQRQWWTTILRRDLPIRASMSPPPILQPRRADTHDAEQQQRPPWDDNRVRVLIRIAGTSPSSILQRRNIKAFDSSKNQSPTGDIHDHSGNETSYNGTNGTFTVAIVPSELHY